MAKNRRLDRQFMYAINSARAHRQSKRADKCNGASSAKIYSYSYANDLLAFGKALGTFIHKAHPDVKRVCDITPAMIAEYINRDSAADSTRTKELAYVRKLDLVMRKAYGGHGFNGNVKDMKAVMRGTEKKHDFVFDEANADKLVQQMRKGGRSEAWKAVLLSSMLGLRDNECASLHVSGRFHAEGGRWGYGYVELKGKLDGCKGGRPRIVDILTESDAECLRALFSEHSKGTVIQKADGCPLSKNSINRAIERAVRTLGIPWKSGNGCHAFRKLFAQNCYDKARQAGMSKRDAEEYAISQLGHGRGREELKSVYIASRW